MVKPLSFPFCRPLLHKARLVLWASIDAEPFFARGDEMYRTEVVMDYFPGTVRGCERAQKGTKIDIYGSKEKWEA